MTARARREAVVTRKTAETDIMVTLVVDGGGTYTLETGVPFFDHMLSHLAKHAGWDLTVRAQGDIEVDAHHTVEDVGICLGQAVQQALGDKAGIARYGAASVPMEEALVSAALDLSGRPLLVYRVDNTAERVGQFDSELAQEFWMAFSRNAQVCLHINLQYGSNQHHIIEAVFKAVARALREATTVVGGGVPSTKGVL